MALRKFENLINLFNDLIKIIVLCSICAVARTFSGSEEPYQCTVSLDHLFAGLPRDLLPFYGTQQQS